MKRLIVECNFEQIKQNQQGNPRNATKYGNEDAPNVNRNIDEGQKVNDDEKNHSNHAVGDQPHDAFSKLERNHNEQH